VNPDGAVECSGVLIAEDDLEILETLTALMEDEGYRVVAVRNGHEALAALRTPGRAPPCMILLDLMMPGMNGIEFRNEQLRDPALSGIPVVLLTADHEGRRIGEAMKVATTLVGQFCGRAKP
jgi:CheY-like chemotaxis protein